MLLQARPSSGSISASGPVYMSEPVQYPAQGQPSPPPPKTANLACGAAGVAAGLVGGALLMHRERHCERRTPFSHHIPHLHTERLNTTSPACPQTRWATRSSRPAAYANHRRRRLTAPRMKLRLLEEGSTASAHGARIHRRTPRERPR
jgi:hypothetical protein